MKKTPLTHRKSNTRTYNSWEGMKGRCLNPNNQRWESYGGRGITVCERWLNFDNFLADMGDRPKGRSLDRIDNNGNYELSNCRWATPRQQQNNMKTNILLQYKGRTKTLTQWARFLKMEYCVLRFRIKRGWTVERAFNRPIRRRNV